MGVLTARNLSLSYGDRVILDDASLVIQDRERVGLVGRNGSGKTSLAHILAGWKTPDAGEVVVAGSASVAFLAQQPRFPEGATAREVVSSGLETWNSLRAEYDAVTAELGAGGPAVDGLLTRQANLVASIELCGGWDLDHQVESITGHLGVERLDDPVAAMSGGERRRVDLARVLISRPSVAILDEPTNHLDIETIEWLEDFLADQFEGALLLITHDRYVLDRLVSRTVELSRGSLISYDGGWEDYLSARAEREAHAARAESNRQNLLRRELDWLRRSPKARTTKSKSRVKRAEALLAERPESEREMAAIRMETARSGKIAFELSHVTVEAHGKTLIRDLDLVVSDGERLGIVGPNGIGKTTLLRVLLGQLEPTGGEVKIAKNTRFAYFDQERAQLDEDATVLENVCGNRDQVEVGGSVLSIHGYLSRFLFDGDQQRQKVSTLSGGERARVQLARFLLEPANVILLDEPTNDLDVATLGALEDFLLDAGVTALFVTHDRYFLDRVAEGVLAYEGDGRVVRYQGSYQAFVEARARRSAEEREASGPAPASGQGENKDKGKSKSKPRPPKTGLTFTEAHELEGLMPLVEEAETEVARLEGALADPDLYARRGEQVKGLQEELAAARSLLEERISRWEELESKREAGDP